MQELYNIVNDLEIKKVYSFMATMIEAAAVGNFHWGILIRIADSPHVVLSGSSLNLYLISVRLFLQKILFYF